MPNIHGKTSWDVPYGITRNEALRTHSATAGRSFEKNQKHGFHLKALENHCLLLAQATVTLQEPECELLHRSVVVSVL